MAGKVPLSEATTEYLAHMQARGRQPATIKLRASSLRRMRAVLGDATVWTIDARDIDKVFTHHAQAWSAATRNQKLTHYKVFFGWCRARGYMHRDSNPLFGWEMNALPRPNRQRIPQTEWDRLFDACETPIETILIALGLYLFLRVSEAQGLKVKDVHLDKAEIHVYRTKTKDFDIMPISAELDGHLRTHLRWLAEQGAAQPQHHLVPGREKPTVNLVTHAFSTGSGVLNPNKPHGRPYKVIQRVLERGGYETFREGGHTLRRSGARAYFDALSADGYDGALRRVQSMLGHRNSDMTQLYLGLDPDRYQRNKALAGKPMFKTRVQDAKVVPIRRGS